MTTKNEPKKAAPLAEELRATIDRVEQTHREILATDEHAPGGENARWTGTRPSHAMLYGSSYDEAPATARLTAKGMWSPCARETGGCGTLGYVGGDGGRAVCPRCHGAGRIPSAAGLELLRFVLDAIATPQPRPDATPEALEQHNRQAIERRKNAEEAQRRQLDAMRENARQVGAVEHARAVMNANKSEVQ